MNLENTLEIKLHAILTTNYLSTDRLRFLTKNRLPFLKLCCTELTYEEIARQMGLSYRTVDGYRNDFFKCFKVTNRAGIVLYALKNEFVALDDLSFPWSEPLEFNIHKAYNSWIMFLRLCCTQLTYNEIAYEMKVSTKAVNHYCADLCERLNLNGRIGLILYALKNKLVLVEELEL